MALHAYNAFQDREVTVRIADLRVGLLRTVMLQRGNGKVTSRFPPWTTRVYEAWVSADVWGYQKRLELAPMRSARAGAGYVLIRSCSKRGVPPILASV